MPFTRENENRRHLHCKYIHLKLHGSVNCLVDEVIYLNLKKCNDPSESSVLLNEDMRENGFST